MHPDKINRLNGMGVVLRFVHPALFAIISGLILFILTGLKDDMKEVKASLSNHLNHHQTIEINLADRLGRIETQLDKLWK